MENVIMQNGSLSEAEAMRKAVKRRKTIASTVYYVCGALLAALFLFPLVYMLATSTKSEAAYATDTGTLRMFLPDFGNLAAAGNNYKKVFVSYGVWQYALNCIMYAAVQRDRNFVSIVLIK